MYHVGFAIALNSIGMTTIVIDFNTNTIKHATIPALLESGIDARIAKELEQKNEYIIEHKQKIDEYFAS